MKREKLITIFSSNMKNIRQRQELTQEELSFRCGLHRNYISDTERGKRNVTLKAIEKISSGLNVKVIELFKEIEK
ncbi:helix-turn-helix domain-containing protein [Spiroplasma taiwanense]|uniref:HTH cro/C1-type domain-containing protein n=1 Tax=Spiroplasma taiwanense CT-1 TaxID=1276220 RepID=S5LW01_9MOLU|nr:helix-turn-helix transcriptional regulator [Spiroplasma taiwanense]AGR40771.1 hypothetical protein STAIW_v1c00790 [Spiroplasma taiwanense CT-1]